MPQFQIQTFLIQTIYLIVGLFLFIFLSTKYILTAVHATIESRKDIIAKCGNVNSGRIAGTAISSYVLSAAAKVSNGIPHVGNHSN
jgi:hypothetical protein